MRARRALSQVFDIITHIEPALPGDFPVLLSGAEADRLHDQIMAIADRVGSVGASHHVILRHSHALDRIDVSLHCHAPGSMPLIEAHVLSECVERELRAALPQLDHITIHVEPAGSIDN